MLQFSLSVLLHYSNNFFVHNIRGVVSPQKVDMIKIVEWNFEQSNRNPFNFLIEILYIQWPRQPVICCIEQCHRNFYVVDIVKWRQLLTVTLQIFLFTIIKLLEISILVDFLGKMCLEVKILVESNNLHNLRICPLITTVFVDVPAGVWPKMTGIKVLLYCSLSKPQMIKIVFSQMYRSAS